MTGREPKDPTRRREEIAEYVDGECSPEAAAAFEHEMALDAALRSETESERELNEQLRVVCQRRPQPRWSGHELAARVRQTAQRRSRLRLVGSVAAVMLFGVLTALVIRNVQNTTPPATTPPSEGPVADALDPDLLDNLDLLEAFLSSGIEPTEDVVETLIEPAEDLGEEVFPDDLYEVLREELPNDN